MQLLHLIGGFHRITDKIHLDQHFRWNLELGDYGCLPMELGKFFQKNGFFNISLLLNKLDRTLQIHCWNLWKIHTKAWEESYQIQFQQQQLKLSQQQPSISQFFHPL